MFQILYSFHLQMGATEVVVLNIVGPCWAAGGVFVPGFQDGEIYTPGFQEGEEVC